MKEKTKKRYLWIDQEALNIGITKKTKRRVWLETKVTVKFDDGTITIKTFDSFSEANKYTKQIMRESSICA